MLIIFGIYIMMSLALFLDENKWNVLNVFIGLYINGESNPSMTSHNIFSPDIIISVFSIIYFLYYFSKSRLIYGLFTFPYTNFNIITPNLTLYFPLTSSIFSVIIRFTGLIVLLGLHFLWLYYIINNYFISFLIFDIFFFFITTFLIIHSISVLIHFSLYQTSKIGLKTIPILLFLDNIFLKIVKKKEEKVRKNGNI